MRGYMVTSGRDRSKGPDEMAPWESIVVDAVGNVIEFWGFKRNQGRVWALLYLRATPMSASDIQTALSLSKGAVSMISRELEQWGIVHRVRPPGSAAWHFVAETDLMAMLMRVLTDRESSVVARVKTDLGEAERMARERDDVPEDVVDRLIRMRMLSVLIERALTDFLKTSRLNMNPVSNILEDAPLPQTQANGESSNDEGRDG